MPSPIKHVMLSTHDRGKRATYCGLVLAKERVPLTRMFMRLYPFAKYGYCKRCVAGLRKERAK